MASLRPVWVTQTLFQNKNFLKVGGRGAGDIAQCKAPLGSVASTKIDRVGLHNGIKKLLKINLNNYVRKYLLCSASIRVEWT